MTLLLFMNFLEILYVLLFDVVGTVTFDVAVAVVIVVVSVG